MNTENTVIESIVVHEIGDKSHQQDLVLSKQLLAPDSDELDLLKRFFLDHFKAQEYYNFRMASPSVPTSRIYQPVAEVFEDPTKLMASSYQIARFLYAYTESDMLGHGYLFMTYFKDIMVGDELTDAIGLFFCQSEDLFLTPENIGTNPQLRFSSGTFTGKQEIACLIFDTDEEDGYKIDVIDRSKKNKEGQLWRDLFLQLKPADDDFFKTSHLMGLTKSFVDHQLPMEFEVARKEQLDYLDKSIDYFKNQDHYSEQDFAGHIFDDFAMTKSFGDYRRSYEDNHNVELPTDFEINEHAVKKQAKNFKSVLKLDRNFHIYIHGDRSMIERGVDDSGRKFYKIYYQSET
ncbi:MAG: nucleoid-associated protein [Saprospiraceae bacterium]|nr:nucleoid-associated protein [Saprospiraceae bacterium]